MKLQLTNVSYEGPKIAHLSQLEGLPEESRELLVLVNGFIQYAGGLHVRGVGEVPDWHSLHYVWDGPLALHARYPALTPEDVPFGQDALGDQFLLREDRVHRLLGETGDLVALNVTLYEFLAAAQADPIGYLSLEPLAQLYQEGGRLEPGQLLSATPPFCTEEAKAGVSLRAVPALERIAFLADFSRQISGAG
ncbi:MAG: SMI1/KNR4 family protein [Armatimonadetes bacterium]|nr:SMI1/KNR4 family protein [Armatimonadota bacterium]